jgi:hypothetical protein
MDFFENIGNAISGAVNTVKEKVSGPPVPITETTPVQPPLTQMAGRRKRKTRKGRRVYKRSRKNVSRK